MKTKISILATIGLLSLPCVAARTEATTGTNRFQPLVINQTTDVEFPPAMLAQGYLKGRVTMLITVDASGKLTDSLALSYTQPYFAHAVQAALHAWTFEPARMNGEPVGVTKEVEFNFEQGGYVVVSQNVSQFADTLLRQFTPEELVYRAYSIKEIDGKLRAIRDGLPSYTKGLAAKGVSGTVTLAYYVDEKGMVRMPIVLNDADPELANLAVDAVKQWQFEPPTRNGKPVLVSVRQDILFKPPNRS
jgi:TonB family protein